MNKKGFLRATFLAAACNAAAGERIAEGERI